MTGSFLPPCTHNDRAIPIAAKNDHTAATAPYAITRMQEGAIDIADPRLRRLAAALLRRHPSTASAVRAARSARARRHCVLTCCPHSAGTVQPLGSTWSEAEIEAEAGPVYLLPPPVCVLPLIVALGSGKAEASRLLSGVSLDASTRRLHCPRPRTRARSPQQGSVHNGMHGPPQQQ